MRTRRLIQFERTRKAGSLRLGSVIAAVLLSINPLLVFADTRSTSIETSSGDSSLQNSISERVAKFGPDEFESPPEPAPNYARDRKVDIEHVKIDVTPNFEERSLKGLVTFSFKPIAQPLDELKFDGVDLSIEDIQCNEHIASREVTDKELTIRFSPAIKPESETKLSIRYSAKPQKGMYFRVPSNGYPAGDMHLFTQGEQIESRHWFPSYDFPNEKFTSEITCHVPKGMTVVSNGHEISSETDSKTGLVTVTWLQDKPHVNYLVTLDAGYFAKIEDDYHGLPLSFYTVPSQSAYAPEAFSETKKMLECFEKATGVKYPWDKYGQLLPTDFAFGGMENTSITTLNSDAILHSKDTENLDVDETYGSQGIIAHELAHQWFGDLLTCKDWSQAWLNEGFASYFAHLYREFAHGHNDFQFALYRDKQNLSWGKNETATVDRRVDQFGGDRTYMKPSWVLHMLRCELGDELFQRCVQTYIERHMFGSVVTEDFNKVVEELSGRSFDRFFQQWIFTPGLLKLRVSYNWDEQKKLASWKITQERKGSGKQKTPVYEFPVTLRCKNRDGVFDRKVLVRKEEEDFSLSLKHAPDLVRFDPEQCLLAQVHFRLPLAVLYRQLLDDSDVVGRLIAARDLGQLTDGETVARLKTGLQNDAFYGVRMECADSLSRLHNDEALDALISSIPQTDARVRRKVVQEINRFYSPAARDALVKVVQEEKNSKIINAALTGLGRYNEPSIVKLILEKFESKSYQNTIACGSLEAINTMNDLRLCSPLMQNLKEHEQDYLTSEIRSGLVALARIARLEDNKDAVRSFIEGYLHHKRELVQTGAMSALSELGDGKAIVQLEPFVQTTKDTVLRHHAEDAIAAIREVNRPSDNLKDLRRQILDEKENNVKLTKEIEELKKFVTSRPNKRGSAHKAKERKEIVPKVSEKTAGGK